MRASFRHALLGVSALALTAVAIGGAILTGGPASPEAAETAPRPAPSTLPGGPSTPQALPRVATGQEYDACLALLRTDPEGAIARAGAWEEQGGGEGARHCLALGLLAAGEADRAAGRLERLAAASAASGPARAGLYAQAAQAWMMAGAPNRAYGASTLALTLLPDDPALLVDRAVAAAALGRYGEALQDLDRAVGLDGNRAEAWVFRSATLRHLDRPEDAMRDAERALSLEANNPEALLERGILRQLQGDTAGARADWQQIMRVAPDSPAADLAMQNLALNEAGPRRR